MRRYLLLLLFALALSSVPAVAARCNPTPEDEMGPFYRPGAPLRSQIGSGYILHGRVMSATDCKPIPASLIELWQAGPDGRYTDTYRAAIITGADGRYRLETNPPPAYVSRPPHIHIRVTARSYKTLVTQHYLQPGRTDAVFDLVLEEEEIVKREVSQMTGLFVDEGQ